MRYRILILLFFFLVPSLLYAPAADAKGKKHIDIAPDQECADCHTAEAEKWMGGKHGLMNVKCVICHDSSEKSMAAKKDIYKCRGCHGEKVKDIEEKFPAKSRNCFMCHDYHSVTVSFHSKGGK